VYEDAMMSWIDFLRLPSHNERDMPSEICKSCGTIKVSRKTTAKYCSRTCVAAAKTAAALERRGTGTPGEIVLPDGTKVRVSLEDYEWTHMQPWFVSKTRGYVVTNGKGIMRRQIQLHRAVAEHMIGRKLKRNELVDHKNHDLLDARRCNIRIATSSLNQVNRYRNINSESGYKGVANQHGAWRALITIDGINIYLGRFEDAAEAAYVYDQAALQLYGEFASTNFSLV
jgi:hypothetical protein